MVEQLSREHIAQRATIHAAPPATQGGIRTQPPVDRTFELPRALYAATVACFLGFLAVMGAGFSSPGMILPMAIFVLFIVAGFGVPTIWTRISPESDSKAMSLSKFAKHGIHTLTGHTSASQASVQVLILPVLILVWGMAVVTIAAFVG